MRKTPLRTSSARLALAFFVLSACADDAFDADGGASLDAAADGDSVSSFFEAQMEQGGIPGLALAVVGPNGVWWSGTYGAQDLEGGTPVSEDSLFPVASVSKLIVGLMLMEAIEAGELSLEDDAAEHLSHPFEHPLHPDVAPSVGSLATHTSGLRDTFTLFALASLEGDPQEELGTFTASYALPSGELYSTDNFSQEPPGTSYEYCNFGFALLGHVLEGATGQSFRSLSNDLFTRLEMDSGYFLADVDADALAIPYSLAGESFRRVSSAETRYYPAGGMKSSLRDMSRLLQLFLRDGELEGERILEESSIAEMENVAHPDLDPLRGLVLNRATFEGHLMHGHGGAGFGGSADVWYGSEFGIVVLGNSDAYVRDLFGNPAGAQAMRAIRSRLVQLGESMSGR